MINAIHSVLYRPERGWDPVSEEHCRCYSEHAWRDYDEGLIDWLEQRIGALAGKRVLDLGGGPGQYSVGLARRGARVLWHDISRRYLELMQDRARRNQVQIESSLGYLEDATRFTAQPFDLVFVRACWCYCIEDRNFARLVYALVKPSGAGYVDTPTPAFAAPRGLRKLQYLLDGSLGLKIGHPHPPRGRVARLFNEFPLDRLEVDYASPLADRLLFVKSPGGQR